MLNLNESQLDFDVDPSSTENMDSRVRGNDETVISSVLEHRVRGNDETVIFRVFGFRVRGNDALGHAYG